MATPHIGAELGDVAKTVIMPGDPLRAKFIADTFLTDVKQYNQVRGMLGFTGKYKGKSISVQGSGMGCPSIGIYSYELYSFFGVENIMRVGTAGAYHPDLHIGDVVLAQGASTDSTYASQYGLPGTIAPLASFELLEPAVGFARAKGCPFKVGNVLSTDIFYHANPAMEQWAEMGVVCAEMETAALYLNAAKLGKKALTILTISDEVYSGRETTAEERQTSFTTMMEIALDTAASLS